MYKTVIRGGRQQVYFLSFTVNASLGLILQVGLGKGNCSDRYICEWLLYYESEKNKIIKTHAILEFLRPRSQFTNFRNGILI